MPRLAATASEQGTHTNASWLLLLLLPFQAAARNMRSRKEPRQPRSSFNALIEMGGASAQVTFMPDVQWHSSSSSNSNRQESLLLSLPGEGFYAVFQQQ